MGRPCVRMWVRAAVAVAVVLAALGAGAAAHAQGQNPSSAANPYYGSVTAQPATETVLPLALDDAVQRGLRNNLGLRQAEDNERALQGEKKEALQQFLPTIQLTGDSGVHQQNLAAQGFGPKVISEFKPLFPGGKLPPGLSTITRDTLTEGDIRVDETLFSGPVIAGWKAAGAATRSAYFAKMTARGEVVQQVATAYLHALAADSEVENARARVAADQVQFDNARAAHAAGTAAHLDELRAQVQLETDQQELIAAQDAEQKDLILLKRETGIAPGQAIRLTDQTPYSELAAQTPDQVCAVAYASRQDYQNLQNQLVEYKAVHAAYRSQRLPTLRFSGFYGVDNVNGAGSHGVFAVAGTLSVPIFREASLRGNIDTSAAQLSAVNAQLADLRVRIEYQVRSALLDVEATRQLVGVARSNVELAARTVSDEIDRVSAGVDDNLPLVTAQATLAQAQSNLVESLYQYNLSKLALARAAGILEQQYRSYLGE